MGPSEGNPDNYTVWCGNLSEEVTDEVLFELFNQAGPVESVRRPRDQDGRPKSFAFILYRHECSVPYALEIFRGTKLFNRNINLNSRSTFREHIPVLDTHLTEFTEPQRAYREGNFNEGERYGSGNYERSRRDESSRRGDYRHQDYQRRESGRDSNEPSSWAELNALRGKNPLTNGHRSDLHDRQDHVRRPDNIGHAQPIQDFNALLQMGQQMMINPQLMSGLAFFNALPQMGLGPNLGGNNMFPSMHGRMSGGERSMPERDTGRRDQYHERRDNRRDHPYNDRGRNELRDDHRRHDRGYSSSRSSHDREKTNRRSR